ncbi:hypothetical protein I302_105987 [Kwoniella bestiolae CBS 10118]|uniref:Myb-like domain-containing protein n=1 Tax=Kwoniella bestiolae CBS 10118 TaxID=1296100 RepID=A0A1B9G2Q3_9TREE|nr:hypothetical protein I302_05111 [Kwoniella bestiolae CBS 10118]OCF25297.1 hypothetical protein I302_05111 [Kwoniella bestiolae CBS 10118]
MPAKREYSSDSDDKPNTASGSPKKSHRKEKQPWSEEEETKFLLIIDDIVKTHLWHAVKEHPEIAIRKGGAVRSHWDAMLSPSCSFDDSNHHDE